MIAGELDLADLDFWPLDNLKNENDGVARSDALVLRRDLGELAPMLAEQLLQHHFGFLDLGRIEWAFNAQSDLSFLEAIENVGFGGRMIALIADPANDRPLAHLEDDDLAVGAVRR